MSEARPPRGTSASDADDGLDRRRLFFAALWIGAMAFATRDALRTNTLAEHVDPLEAALFDGSTALPALHLLLFLGVVARRRATLLAPADATARPVAGLLLAGVGLALLVWSGASGHPDLQMDTLVLLVTGAFVALGGLRRLERGALPLALLLLGRPLPPMFVHHVHDLLQRFTAGFAEATLSPFMPVARSGLILGADDRLFQVIEGCSGFRLEISLVTATLVYAEYLSRSRRHTLALVAGAVLLGPILNGLRVVSIMLDPTSSVSETHSTQGLIVIAAGIVSIGVLDAVAERLVDRRRASAGNDATPTSRGVRGGLGASAGTGAPRPAIERSVLALAPLALGLHLALPAEAPATERGIWALHEVGARIGAWKRTRTHGLDREYWGAVAFTNRLDWSYTHDDGVGRARLLVAADDRRRRDRSAYSPKTERRGPEWWIVERAPVADVPGPATHATRTVQTNGVERWMSLHYRIGTGSLANESLRWWLALDARRDAVPAETVVVRIDVELAPGREARAAGRLLALARAVGAALERAQPGSPVQSADMR